MKDCFRKKVYWYDWENRCNINNLQELRQSIRNEPERNHVVLQHGLSAAETVPGVQEKAEKGACEEMKYYLVTTPGERETIVKAENATQAKRKACKDLGIRSSDPWCGISAMKAKRIDLERSV